MLCKECNRTPCACIPDVNKRWASVSYGLCECPVCAAAVAEGSKRQHTEWHKKVGGDV